VLNSFHLLEVRWLFPQITEAKFSDKDRFFSARLRFKQTLL